MARFGLAGVRDQSEPVTDYHKLGQARIQLLVCRGSFQSSTAAGNRLFCGLWRTAAGHQRRRLRHPELWNQLGWSRGFGRFQFWPAPGLIPIAGAIGRTSTRTRSDRVSVEKPWSRIMMRDFWLAAIPGRSTKSLIR